jgi:hypothetical protein
MRNIQQFFFQTKAVLRNLCYESNIKRNYFISLGEIEKISVCWEVLFNIPVILHLGTLLLINLITFCQLHGQFYQPELQHRQKNIL